MRETSHNQTETVWFHVREVPAVLGITEMESTMGGGARGWGAGGGLVFNGDRVSLCQNEMGPGDEGGGVCIIGRV